MATVSDTERRDKGRRVVISVRYSVKLAGLLNCCRELEETVRQLRRESDALDRSIRRLKQMSYMDTVCTQLQRERKKLEERIQLTLTMAQAARRCQEAYQKMERQVTEELDCPRHVLTQDGGGTASRSYGQETTGAAVENRTTSAYSSGTAEHAAVDWELEMGPYAAVFAQAGIDVRLED